MKKLLCFILGAALCLSLAACTPKAPETAKATELKAQYTFYEKSVKEIVNKMSVTPEQADDIFIAFVECGLNQDISYIMGSDTSGYTVNFGKIGEGVTNLNITLNSGVVEKITESGKVIYPESLVEEERLAAEESEREAAQQAKDVALLMDSQLIEFVKSSQEIIVLLQEGITLLEESNDVLSLFNLADTAETSQKALLSSVGSVRDKDNKAYVEAVQNYIVNGQIICEKLKKYLDGGSLENLTDVQNRLSSSEAYYGDVLDARKDYLSSQGYSDEEIAELFLK